MILFFAHYSQNELRKKIQEVTAQFEQAKLVLKQTQNPQEREILQTQKEILQTLLNETAIVLKQARQELAAQTFSSANISPP